MEVGQAYSQGKLTATLRFIGETDFGEGESSKIFAALLTTVVAMLCQERYG